MSDGELSHLDEAGRPRMVDVGAKEVTARVAVAAGRLQCSQAGWEALQRPGGVGKGDPQAVAQIAAVQAAKRTADWIPLAHPLPLDGVNVGWQLHEAARVVQIEVEVRVRARTGVEMEALTAVSAGLLALYDMLKAVDRAMVIGPIWLRTKTGGKSGRFEAEDPPLAPGE